MRDAPRPGGSAGDAALGLRPLGARAPARPEGNLSPGVRSLLRPEGNLSLGTRGQGGAAV
ncbi:MAG: hypothetical protein C4331_14545 [Meiothermus sp.]